TIPVTRQALFPPKTLIPAISFTTPYPSAITPKTTATRAIASPSPANSLLLLSALDRNPAPTNASTAKMHGMTPRMISSTPAAVTPPGRGPRATIAGCACCIGYPVPAQGEAGGAGGPGGGFDPGGGGTSGGCCMASPPSARGR